ncbi:MAG: DUF2188 domain-containing protein [Candidatus Spechtbacterales bacterium]
MSVKWKKLPKKDTLQIRSYEAALRRGRKSQHVIHADSGWAVKRAGATRPSKVFDKKTNAVNYAKNVSKKNRTDLYIHDKNGRIQKSHSY